MQRVSKHTHNPIEQHLHNNAKSPPKNPVKFLAEIVNVR